MAKKETDPVTVLKGWTAIAKFLGTSPASAQTWAKQEMPVRRGRRFTIADPVEVQAWLGQQSQYAETCTFSFIQTRSPVSMESLWAPF